MEKLIKVLEERSNESDIRANVERVLADGYEPLDVACELFGCYFFSSKLGEYAKYFIPADDKAELTNWLIKEIINDEKRALFLQEFLEMVLLAGYDVDLVLLDKAEKETGNYNYAVSNAMKRVLLWGENLDFNNIEIQLANDTFTAWIVAENMHGFLSRGVEIDFAQLAKNILAGKRSIQCSFIVDNLKLFIDGGADIDIDELIEIVEQEYWESLAENLDELMEAGANVDVNKIAKHLLEHKEFLTLGENIREFVKYGAEIDLNALVDRLAECGASGRKILEDNYDWFLAEGIKYSLD